MEVLKSERTLARIEDPSVLSFSDEQIYLWVIHANKIPPHLGISRGNEFFSLKANGKDDGLQVTKILQVLRKKKIATAFYEINPDGVSNNPKSVFAQFECTVPGEVTCLEPLKQIFNDSDATWLKGLLQRLEAREIIKSAFGWQLPVDFLHIPDYNPTDIHRRLKHLQDVQS